MAIEGKEKSFKFLAAMTRNAGVIYKRATAISKKEIKEEDSTIDKVLSVLPAILEDKECERAISRTVAVVVEKKEADISLVDIFKAVNEVFGDEELGNEVFNFFMLLVKAGESSNGVMASFEGATS